MTRDEFMKHAQDEIDRAFSGQRNRMMNLVEQAWAEGKKNAEVSGIEDIVKEAIEKNCWWLPRPTISVETSDFHNENILDWRSTSPLAIDGIPNACRTCSNHPSNGGSGVCHCIMGVTPLKC